MPHAIIYEADENKSRLLAELMSRQGISSKVISEPDAIWDALKNEPDQALIHYDMKNSGGLDIARVVKAAYPNTPIIIYSGSIGEAIEEARKEKLEGMRFYDGLELIAKLAPRNYQ